MNPKSSISIRRLPVSLVASLLLLPLGGCTGVTSSEPTEWVFPVWRSQQLGFINQTGRLVVEPKFLGSLEPGDGLVAVYADLGETQLWGFIDFAGSWVIEPRFTRVGPFSEGFAAFVDEDRLRGGYIDRQGEVVIDPVYESARRFSEGLAAVRVQGKWGFLDPQGKLAIEPRFKSCRDFAEGEASVETDGGTVGYIDPEGQWVVEPRPARGEANPGPTRVEGERKGKPVDQALLEGYNFSEGLAAVRVEDGTWGFIDPQGTWVIEPRFFGAGLFSEGLAPIRIGLRWGYVNRQGEVTIQPRFHEAGKFSLGLAPVKVPGKAWGYVNAAGEVVIDPVYDGAEPFLHGLAAIQTGERYGYIDPQGEVVWEPSR